MDTHAESNAGNGVGNYESDQDDEPWCLAGESQEPDSLSDVEASVLALCASVGDSTAQDGHGMPSLGRSELVGVCDLGEAEETLFLHGEERDALFGVDGDVHEVHKILGALEDSEEIIDLVEKEKEDSMQVNGAPVCPLLSMECKHERREETKDETLAPLSLHGSAL